jgi:hypothetical protein
MMGALRRTWRADLCSSLTHFWGGFLTLATASWRLCVPIGISPLDGECRTNSAWYHLRALTGCRGALVLAGVLKMVLAWSKNCWGLGALGWRCGHFPYHSTRSSARGE